jgi:hypothetical protein
MKFVNGKNSRSKDKKHSIKSSLFPDFQETARLASGKGIHAILTLPDVLEVFPEYWYAFCSI